MLGAHPGHCSVLDMECRHRRTWDNLSRLCMHPARPNKERMEECLMVNSKDCNSFRLVRDASRVDADPILRAKMGRTDKISGVSAKFDP